MRSLAALILTLLAASCARANSPEFAAAEAAAHLARQPREVRPYLRYLTDYAIPERDQPSARMGRDKWKLLKEFHDNSLSTEAEFFLPVRVGLVTYVIDLRRFGWPKEVYERLARVEPHFHEQNLRPLPKVKVEVLVPAEATVEVETTEEREEKVKKPWPGGVWEMPGADKGKYFPPGAFEILVPERRQVKVKRRVPSHGPTRVLDTSDAPPPKEAPAAFWAGAVNMAYLVKETQSAVPIVRSDWFFYQTAIQQKRVAGYYDFLKLGKKLSDFQELGGVDPAVARKKKKEIAGVFSKSEVTLQNRCVIRMQGTTGPYWFTVDFEESTGEKNVVRNPVDEKTNPPKGDASRQYIMLPNGLWATGLFNKDDVRQDVAPPTIAGDGHSRTNDKQVYAGMSCFRCHTQGLKSLGKEYMRNTHRTKDSTFGTPGHDDAAFQRDQRVRQLYFSNIKAELDTDVAYYTRKLKELNGLTPAQAARLVDDGWFDYADRDLTLDDFARELGVETKFMIDTFKKVGRNGLDPVLGGLIPLDPPPGGWPKGEEPEPKTLRREHADEIFPEAQRVLRGLRRIN